MDWEAINAIAESLGAIGAVVGLIFVYRELKNVRKTQYAAASQRIVDSERELWTLVLANPAATEFMAQHVDLHPDLLNKLNMSPAVGLQMLLFFRQYENIFYQHSHDMLPDGLWEHWKESMVHSFRSPIAQTILKEARTGYSHDFKRFLETEILPATDPLTGSA